MKVSAGITIHEFEIIYSKKINEELQEKGKFRFTTDMNVLLNAYEFYRYEKRMNKRYDNNGN